MVKGKLDTPKCYNTNTIFLFITGIGVRALQMGIRQAPIFHAPMGFVYSAAFTTTVGYYFEQWVQKNDELLELRLAKLKKLRESSA